MNQAEFERFMLAQAAFFKERHEDCNKLTKEQIAEDSLEFRRRWDKEKKDETV